MRGTRDELPSIRPRLGRAIAFAATLPVGRREARVTRKPAATGAAALTAPPARRRA